MSKHDKEEGNVFALLAWIWISYRFRDGAHELASDRFTIMTTLQQSALRLQGSSL